MPKLGELPIRGGVARSTAGDAVYIRGAGYWFAAAGYGILVYGVASSPWLGDGAATVLAAAGGVFAGVYLERRWKGIRIDATGVDVGHWGHLAWERIERVERGSIVLRTPIEVSKLYHPTGKIRRWKLAWRTSPDLVAAVRRFSPATPVS